MNYEAAMKKDYSVPSFKKWGNVKDLTRGDGGVYQDAGASVTDLPPV